jgi:hypothetical protein
MSMKLRTPSIYFLTICMFTLPALAQNDIYDNGPTNGSTDAWTISSGFVVSDSFTFTRAEQVSGLEFAVWLMPGDVLQSAEVLLTSDEDGGATYFDQQVNFTQSGCVRNQYAYNVCNETGSFPAVGLLAGTYWLNLGNAVINNGDPVYWDENSGPSMASEGILGTLPSESFTILGGSPTGSTPEPGGLLLFGSGVFGLGAMLRRKLFLEHMAVDKLRR